MFPGAHHCQEMTCGLRCISKGASQGRWLEVS